MKLNKSMIVWVAAAGLGLGVSAMAQGRPGMGRPAGPPASGPGMGGPGMPGQAGPMGPMGQMGQSGRMGQAGQMGRMSQNNQMRMQSQGKTVSQLLTRNTKLSSSLQTILGLHVNLQDAASGFKNLGTFVAAVHLSKNLKIPFSQLKTTMAGDGYNLGKAIHSLDPAISKKQVKDAVKLAKRQAKADIQHSRS